jgi:succinate-acetate transporter protein
MVCVVDVYLDLPAPFSVPLSAYVVLVGAPLLIAVSLRAPVLDASRPKSLQNFIRFLPWLLSGWWCFTAFLFVVTLVSNAHVKSILFHR